MSELTLTFTEPFFGGLTGSDLVPGKYHVALDGRPYLIDLASDAYRHRSIPQIRQQADTSERPGESSLNPDEMWRRAQESWHRGAGQEFLDRADSDPFRFNTSKGVDVFGDKYQISLLPATDQKRTSTNTNLELAVAGSHLYLADGQQVYHTQDVTVDAPTWTSADIQNSESAQTVEGIASNGDEVYAALGSNGIHKTDAGATSTSHYNALQATLVAYVKGRLMAAETNSVYNVTASGAAPSSLMDHDNTSFRWVGFAEGLNNIYMGGFGGDKSEIWRTAVKSDGTSLDTPVVAGRLPDGEILRDIYGYLGFILIGTDNGVRLATERDDGNLVISALVETDNAVRAFEGQKQFIWFGWSNYDSSSTGLGRLDLTQIFDDGAPAHASDLMASTQGNVLSCATFQSVRVFAVSGDGVYAEDTDLVSSGTIQSGQITYGLPDDKVVMFLDVRHEPLDGSVKAEISADSGAYSNLGTNDVSDSTGKEFQAQESKGETHQIRLTLDRDSSDNTAGPVVTRWTQKARPNAVLSQFFEVPLLLTEHDLIESGVTGRDPADELSRIKTMRAAGRPVKYQELGDEATVFVEDFDWRPTHLTHNKDAWNGTCIVRLKEVT